MMPEIVPVSYPKSTPPKATNRPMRIAGLKHFVSHWDALEAQVAYHALPGVPGGGLNVTLTIVLEELKSSRTKSKRYEPKTRVESFERSAHPLFIRIPYSKLAPAKGRFDPCSDALVQGQSPVTLHDARTGLRSKKVVLQA